MKGSMNSRPPPNPTSPPPSWLAEQCSAEIHHADTSATTIRNQPEPLEHPSLERPHPVFLMLTVLLPPDRLGSRASTPSQCRKACDHSFQRTAPALHTR